MSFLGSLTGGIFDIGTSILNNYYNKKAASQQNAYQWSFWQANNDYNSPKSVMARLEEAGLNPNLVYGNGGASYQATMPTAAKRAPSDIHSSFDPLTFQQQENMEAQNELLKAQKDNAFWQAGLNQSNASKANAEANIAHFKEDYARKEHELFKKTGKIPESYHNSTASGELVSLIRDGLANLVMK